MSSSSLVSQAFIATSKGILHRFCYSTLKPFSIFENFTPFELCFNFFWPGKIKHDLITFNM